MLNKPVVIVLAAGRGERFRASGGLTHKLNAPLAGTPVLQHVIRAVEASGLDMCIVRSAPESGMSDSIAAGVAATPNAAGWLILPGDLPLIQACSLQHVAEALALDKVVVPHYRQHQGHPVGFRKECFDELMQLSGDHGASLVVQAHRALDEVLDLPLNDMGLITDIDTVEDLSWAEELFMQMEHPIDTGKNTQWKA